MSAAITIKWPPCKAFPRGGTETYEIIDSSAYRVCSSGVVCDMRVAEPTFDPRKSRIDNSELFLYVIYSDTQRLMDRAIAAGIESTLQAGPDRKRLLKRFASVVRTNTGYDDEYPSMA